MTASAAITQLAVDATAIAQMVTTIIDGIATLFLTNPLLELAVGLVIVGIGLRFVKGVLHQIAHE